ncbi:hypothetical protein HXX76_003716 [Chlamydomonas incerta]|uniref:Uncharacterized protein n=1 Tax=Chlamydomonas incerta TaxID=51695 RepID=A0A835W519_CHLIN|nr:hypothetical protein HXX76_003716 [Chlamydomonas incerta]|eukprot:KAG2440862.1 hypothetical protein HXX76_003716 [Chlamydomonas incerta]
MLRTAMQPQLGAQPSASTATKRVSRPAGSGLLLIRSTASAGSSSIAQSPAGSSRALRMVAAKAAARGPGGSNARGGQQQQAAGAPGSPFIKAAAIAFVAAAATAAVGAAAAQGPAVRDLQQLPASAAGAHSQQGEVVGMLVATPGPYPGIQLPRTRPVPGEVVTADNVYVGLVVRRGPDWDNIYTNWIAAGQDGGPGSNGVVTRVFANGVTVAVRWPATGQETSALRDFAHCDREQHGRVLLVIAHRIDTILDCDSLLVLSAGELVESGPPAALAAGPGVFSKMVAAAKLAGGGGGGGGGGAAGAGAVAAPAAPAH